MAELEKGFTCPLPRSKHSHVLLSHGGGGRLMHQLIEQVFLEKFDSRYLQSRHDGAVLPLETARLAFTTDSYVVRPLFFPGGNIGSLAVHGTVNDLAMCGAEPLFLSAGFIIEEGLPIEVLEVIAESMQSAAAASGVQIVTGDTKVVDKGKGDGLFVNTSGIGIIQGQLEICPQSVRPGDAILISGDLGRHGVAIMNARENLAFQTALESDSASVAAPVLDMLGAGVEIHCLRDLTRGGLASALVEVAEGSGLHHRIEEKAVPVCDPVRGACEILGLDPIHVANEGRFAAWIPEQQAEQALHILRGHEVSAGAVAIGAVREAQDRLVTVKTPLGTVRIIDMISGEQLPRIC